MEKAVVLGMGVNRQSASDALSGGGRWAAAWLRSCHVFLRDWMCFWGIGLRCVCGGWGGVGWGGARFCPLGGRAFVRCYSCVPAASPHPCPHLSIPFLRSTPAPAAPADLIVRYAELLSSNGRLGMALEYLSMIPGEQALAGLAELCLKAAACGGHWLAQTRAGAPGALLPAAHPCGPCARLDPAVPAASAHPPTSCVQASPAPAWRPSSTAYTRAQQAQRSYPTPWRRRPSPSPLVRGMLIACMVCSSRQDEERYWVSAVTNVTSLPALPTHIVKPSPPER